jgi:hypothetical protein
MEKHESTTKEQFNISNHEQFNNFVSESLRIGAHVCGAKSHGKTRLGFCVASELMKLPNVRVIAFDGSLAWVFGFSRIPTFTIGERDILANSRKTTDEIEKFTLENWNLVKLALDTHKDLLFNLKPRSPSRRGFFIRTVINYLDAIQRKEKETSPNHENSKALAYFIEESQNAFNSKSSQSLECETFQTVFSEGRNNREGFLTNSQRLTDCSKTIRTKQYYCLGRLNVEDITPALRKIEKAHNLDFANMKPKTWYYEGLVFESPEFKQSGKPYKINAEIKQAWLKNLPKTSPQTLSEKIQGWLKPFMLPSAKEIIERAEQKRQQRAENLTIQQQAIDEEDNEMDDMFLLDPLSEEEDP